MKIERLGPITMKIQKCLGCMREIGADITRCPHCGFCKDDPVPPHLLPPETLLHNAYLVGKLLRTDGEGVTYLGYDKNISRPVMIREYLPLTLVSRELEDIVVKPGCEAKFKALKSDFVDLYLHLADLKVLPNILKVYEVFEEHNTMYAICEYVENQSLNDYLIAHAGELTWEQAAGLFKPLLESLVVIHSSGVIHRGISPETIAVSSNGNLKLMGFAICSARAVGSEIQSTLYEGYAAPEQYSLMVPHGEWTDVYAICAVLYKVLTGTMPPNASSRAINDNLIDLYQLNHTVPQYISRAVMGGLRYEYTERTQTMRDLINMLYFATRMDQTTLFSSTAIAKQPSVRLKEQEPEEDEISYYKNKRQDKYIEYYEEEEEEIHKKPKKNKRKRKMPIWIIVLLCCIPVIILVCLFLYDAMIGFSPKDRDTHSMQSSQLNSLLSEESSEEPSSKEVSSKSEPMQIKTPMETFVGSVYSVSEMAKYKDRFHIGAPIYEYNEAPAGQIFKQSIDPGTEVTATEQLTLYVSKGPRYIVLPPVGGMDATSYIAQLQANYDIVASTRKEYHDVVAAGKVIRVEPSEGSTIDRSIGTVITVVVSIGPDPNKTIAPSEPESSSQPTDPNGVTQEPGNSSSEAAPYVQGTEDTPMNPEAE